MLARATSLGLVTALWMLGSCATAGDALALQNKRQHAPEMLDGAYGSLSPTHSDGVTSTSGSVSHRQEVIDKFVDKLRHSFDGPYDMEKSEICATPTSGSGRCVTLRLCMFPNVTENLATFLKYACAVDGYLMGVCCPEPYVNGTRSNAFPSPVIETEDNDEDTVREQERNQKPQEKGLVRFSHLVKSPPSSHVNDGCMVIVHQVGADPHSLTKRTTARPVPPDLASLSATCGTPNLNKRIVGGENANPDQWTWMAALLRRETGTHYCGGVLISNRYVITAAHCTVGLKATNITVRLGAYNIRESEPNAVDIEVSRLRQHPRFMQDTFMNDISVLRLKHSVKFNEHIRPVCLPMRRTDTFFKKQATVLGWGTRAFGGPYSAILQQVKLRVWNNSECDTKFVQPITKAFLCAGPLKEKGDSCQGDSGGPLMVQDKNTKQWTLIGIVSWGIKCGEPGIPGIYTRVTEYLDFIYEHAVAN
uniref:Putative trypsin-like serine protease n=1 Tax=Ixodes ricinus TaxID=34613 RepID=A0A147BBW4_IXORI